MDEAISELSLKCNPIDSKRALYLISAPSKEMNMDLVKALGDYMRDIAPEALIRNGDYPRERGVLDVTVILSELSDVEKVRYYYSKSTSLIPEFKRRQESTESKLRAIEEASKEIPSLL
jgi:cell division GTPase FtsZ